MIANAAVAGMAAAVPVKEPMPFILATEEAVDIIDRAIRNRRRKTTRERS